MKKTANKKTAASNPYSIGKNGNSPAMRGESHCYDSNRPKNPVVSRYAK